MFKRSGRPVFLGAILAVVVAIAACSDSENSVLEPPAPSFNQTTGGGDPEFTVPPIGGFGDASAEHEFVEVCKAYAWGTSTPAVTITVDVDSHIGDENPISFQKTLFDGGNYGANGDRCRDVWVHGGAGSFSTVTLTETVPAGFGVQYDKTVSDFPVGSCVSPPANSCGGDKGETGVSSNTVSGRSWAKGGFLVTFTNYPAQGCTPGYWKQDHHFASWVGYSPGDSFNTVFGVAAFAANTTLLDVLWLPGHGKYSKLNKLAAHAVAALLNSTSGLDFGDASGPITSAQIIADFQGAWDGSKSDQNQQKGEFENLNERACLLN
jgi:hypothetical protein